MNCVLLILTFPSGTTNKCVIILGKSCVFSSEKALTYQGEEGGSEAGLQAGTQKSAAKTVGYH